MFIAGQMGLHSTTHMCPLWQRMEIRERIHTCVREWGGGRGQLDAPLPSPACLLPLKEGHYTPFLTTRMASTPQIEQLSSLFGLPLKNKFVRNS